MLVLLLALACNKADTDSDAEDTDVVQDADGDGFLSPDDCDDHDADVHPGATETCDAVDQDCDGSVDEDAADVRTFYADADHDTYGDPGAPVVACDKVTGEVEDATDCDDADGDVHPGASEVCNGVDDDCDGAVDDGAVDAPTLYVDGDGDGFGGSAVTACPGAGLSAEGDDCDDADAAIHPGATEICDDGVDQDCDPASCRLSGDYDDPIGWGTADVTWRWPVGYWSPQHKWGAWGDVDGDGYDDGLVTYTEEAGEVVVAVQWGGPSVSSVALPGATTFETPDQPWNSVVDAGDVDGDGFDDVLLATGTSAWVAWGSATRPGAVALDEAATAFIGETVEDVGFAGDVDGDGVGDFLVYDGSVETAWLVYGSSSRPTGGALADVASGGMTGATMGRGPFGRLDGGDFDGDGLSDVLVGYRSADTEWTASLFYGDGSRRTGSFTSADADARLVVSAASGIYTDVDPSDLGDVDGDGYHDLGVAAGGDAWVWAGGSARWSGDYVGATASSRYASGGDESDARIAGGDLDADGFSDVAVALPWSTESSSVRVFYGSSSPWGTFDVHGDADAAISGVQHYGVATALDLGGDLDGDGHADLLGVEDGQLDGAWVFLGSGD